jgi:branched-chain amino acid transport system permease protein
MNKLLNHRYSNYIIFGLVLIILPFLQQFGLLKSSTIQILGNVMFYAIVGIGLNILLGYSGLISLGTAGFMGLGAYLAAYLTGDLGLPFLVSLAISVAIPVSIGLVIGLISLRIEGYYLAIATLAVSEILRQVFVEFDFLTNGFSGKNASYPHLLNYLGLDFLRLDRHWTFILLAIFLVGLMIITDNFVNSRTGRALLTMRGSEAAAQAMGINLLKYKLTAFGIATLYAAIGGVLYVHFVRFAYPDSWTLTLSLQIVAVIVIGGMRTMSGPVIGSFVVFGVPELILKRMPIIGDIDGLAFIFTGILIIVVILFYPQGLAHSIHDFKRWIYKRKVVKS